MSLPAGGWARHWLRPIGLQSTAQDSICIKPCLGNHPFGLVLFNEFVGQTKAANFQAMIEQALIAQQRQHGRAETTARAFFNRNQQIMTACEIADQLIINWLSETRISDRD